MALCSPQTYRLRALALLPEHNIMPLSPEQIAKIRKKQQETPEALKRDPLNEYIEGWFHVTLNVRGEAPVLGYIVGDADAADGSANAPRCVLTELGEKVEEVWKTVDEFHPMCKCEEIQVMPEHIHALLHLLPGNREHLGRIVNGLMIGCTHDNEKRRRLVEGHRIMSITTHRSASFSYRTTSL